MNIYEEQLLDGVRDYFEEKGDKYKSVSKDKLWAALYDDLFASDVTGNNGTPFIESDDERKKQVYANVELLVEALDNFNCRTEEYKRALLDSVFADATIRCYLLGPAISKFLREKSKEG